MTENPYIWTPTGYKQLGQLKEKRDIFRELHIYTPWTTEDGTLPFKDFNPEEVTLPLQLTLMKIDGNYCVGDFDTSFEKAEDQNLGIDGLLRWTAHFKHGGTILGEAYVHNRRFLIGTYGQTISFITLERTKDSSEWLAGVQGSLDHYLRGPSPFTSEHLKNFIQNSNLEQEYQDRFDVF